MLHWPPIFRRAPLPAYVAPVDRPYDIVIEVGAGAQYAPAYEGASGSYEFTAIPFAELHYLWLPGSSARSSRSV